MDDVLKIDGRQLAAARALLGLSQADVAAHTGVPVSVVQELEVAGEPANQPSGSLEAVLAALEDMGVLFFDGNYSGAGGPGLRLKQPKTSSLDVNEQETVQYREFLENDAPPGAGG